MNKLTKIELFGGPSDGQRIEMNEENLGLDVQTVAPGHEGKDPKEWKYCNYVYRSQIVGFSEFSGTFPPPRPHRYEYQGQK